MLSNGASNVSLKVLLFLLNTYSTIKKSWNMPEKFQKNSEKRCIKLTFLYSTSKNPGFMLVPDQFFPKVALFFRFLWTNLRKKNLIITSWVRGTGYTFSGAGIDATSHSNVARNWTDTRTAVMINWDLGDM